MPTTAKGDQDFLQLLEVASQVDPTIWIGLRLVILPQVYVEGRLLDSAILDHH